jgi:hypothetical protein
LQVNQNPEQTYTTIRLPIVQAQHTMAAINSAMVTAYSEIGQQIYMACGDNDRAKYGKIVIDPYSRLQARKAIFPYIFVENHRNP